MIEITGMYAHAADAERAFNGLKQRGFGDEVMAMAPPGASERLWTVAIRPPFGTGGIAMEILDQFGPIARSIHHERDRDPGLDTIARLSGPVSPGAISTLSQSKSPGAISALSRSKSPGAISKLSAGWFLSALFGLPS